MSVGMSVSASLGFLVILMLILAATCSTKHTGNFLGSSETAVLCQLHGYCIGGAGIASSEFAKYG